MCNHIKDSAELLTTCCTRHAAASAAAGTSGWGNQSARLILRTRLGAIIFFAACLIVFYYVRVGSCATWISSALGYLPMHVVMTAITAWSMLWWFMPKDPDEQDQVLQVRQASPFCIVNCSPCAPSADA